MPGLIAVLLLAFAAWTGGVWYVGHAAGAADIQHQLDVAQKELADKAQQAKDEAANHITDMEAAYETGEQEAKVITKIVTARGASDVQRYPVFANPVCVLPDASLQLLNDARSGVRPAADSVEPPVVVPEPAAATGRETGDALPANADRRGPVSGVPAAPRSASGSSEVPGSSVRAHPKPKPIH